MKNKNKNKATYHESINNLLSSTFISLHNSFLVNPVIKGITREVDGGENVKEKGKDIGNQVIVLKVVLKVNLVDELEKGDYFSSVRKQYLSIKTKARLKKAPVVDKLRLANVRKTGAFTLHCGKNVGADSSKKGLKSSTGFVREKGSEHHLVDNLDALDVLDDSGGAVPY